MADYNQTILHPTKEEFHERYFREGAEYDTYVFPAGTPLFSAFREKLDAYTPEKVFPKVGNSYFGFHNETAMIYGYSFAYITNQPITLLAIDSIKTLRHLWELATQQNNEYIQRALRISYGFLDEYLDQAKPDKSYKPQLRNSFSGVDWPFVVFLCENGFAGYAANEMTTPSGHTFHPECVICSNGPLTSVDLNGAEYNVRGIPGLATPEDKLLEAESLMEKREVDKGKPVRKKGRMSLTNETSSFPSKLSFWDDDEPEKEGGYRKRKTIRNTNKKRHNTKRNTKKRQNKSRK